MKKVKVLQPLELPYDAMRVEHIKERLIITFVNEHVDQATFTFDDIRDDDIANLTGLKGVMTFTHEGRETQ
jgi:hypothetical protein